MHYYRRFPGDYARDTYTLTLRQHGCYMLLLDYQYSTEHPILDIREANRICRSQDRSDQRAVKFVLETFFALEAEGYWNNRVKEELAYVAHRSEAARAAAHSRHERDKNATKTRHERDTVATELRHQNDANRSVFSERIVPSQCESIAITDSRLQTTIEEKIKVFPPAKTAGVKSTDEFSIFWEAYPKKLGKQEATRAWIKRGCEGRLGDILASLKAWKDVEWREREFIPYPATWLNADRWKETPVGQKGGIDERELERVRALRR